MTFLGIDGRTRAVSAARDRVNRPGEGRLAGLVAEAPKRAFRQRRLRDDEPICSICILEETGEKKKEKEAKVETLWVPAVNNEGAFAR
ncbi:MAG: hypothetical protein J2P46_00760 [Zavarzinella sp.]|nr:hypothetical protein [Zavarzinella sp.]